MSRRARSKRPARRGTFAAAAGLTAILAGAAGAARAEAPPSLAVVVVETGAALHERLSSTLGAAAASLLGAAGHHARVVHPDSPEVSAGADALARRSLEAGVAAYDALRFEEAVRHFDAAAAAAVSRGAAGLTAGELADVFLFRAMALHQLKDARAWDDFVQAALYAPGRTLDPSRFAPGSREKYARASAEMAAKPRGAAVISGPPGARVWVDGAEAGTVPARVAGLGYGGHLVRVEAAGHRVWASRVALVSPELAVEAKPELAPPSAARADARALASFGAAGGAAIVVAVHAAEAAPAVPALGAAPAAGAPPADGAAPADGAVPAVGAVPAGGAAPAEGATPDVPAVTLTVRAVAVADGRELLSAKVAVPAGRAADVGAALGLALRPLLPAPAPRPLTPVHSTPERPAWRFWLPAVIIGGAAVVTAGIAILAITLRAPAVAGFSTTVELPSR